MNRHLTCVLFGVLAVVLMAGPAAAAAAKVDPPANLVEEEIAACKDAAARKVLEKRCIETLQGGASQSDKERACRMLRVLGTPESVPALAALLVTPELSHMARYALEPMPFPEAVKALRDALPKASGVVKVGLINSLGVREDAAAVPLLVAMLKDADAVIVEAAAAALGAVATPEAVAALADFRAKAAKELQPLAAEASLIVADRLVRRGQGAEAAKIYVELQAAARPEHVRMGAFAGLVTALPAEAVARLIQAIGSGDAKMCGLAAQLAAALPAKEATAALAAALPKLPPAGQTALVRALATRKDPAARPAVLELTKDANKDVCVAAVDALGVLGAAADVPVLVGLAASDKAEVAAAAMASLTTLSGAGVNEALAAALKSATPVVRAQILAALAGRGAKAQAGAVAACVSDADAGVRKAALKAVALLGGKAEAEAVLKVLAASKDGPEQAAAAEALMAIASRVREEVLPQVQAAMTGADAATKAVLLGAMGRIGGAKALAAVQAAMADKDDGVKDEAVRVLCGWPEPAVAPQLLELAKSAAKQNHQILALRGYVRLASLAAAADAKATMLTEAMALAKRPDEQRLVLGAWGGVPTAAALKVVMTYLDKEGVAAEAATAAVAIAEKLPAADKPLVADAMKKVVAATKDEATRRQAKKLIGGK